MCTLQSKGVVHRDLKPQNLLLHHSGTTTPSPSQIKIKIGKGEPDVLFFVPQCQWSVSGCIYLEFHYLVQDERAAWMLEVTHNLLSSNPGRAAVLLHVLCVDAKIVSQTLELRQIYIHVIRINWLLQISTETFTFMLEACWLNDECTSLHIQSSLHWSPNY